MNFFEKIMKWLPLLLEGTGITISLSILSVLCALILSVFLALGKISKNKIISSVCSAYVFFFRGTPLILQLFFIYFTLPTIAPSLNIKSNFVAAWIAFALNVAAYLAEIIRAAIQSIDKGQLEASKALGLTYGQAMRLIVIPQAYRRMIPPIGNEFIMVLKDTSIVSMISLHDLTDQAQKIYNSNYDGLVFIPALLIYLIITAIFTLIFNRLEKKFSVYE